MAGNVRESKTILTADDQTGGAFASMIANVKAAQASALGLYGALAGLAGGAVIGGFATMVKGSLDMADSLNKMSQKTGVATEELAKLSYAAKLSDVSNEQLVKGFKGLSDMMVKARDATSLQAEVMKTLGVNIDGGTAPALNKIADMFQKLPDGATKTALAVDLFGKAGQEMIPLLNQGSEGLAKLGDEAEKFGLVIRDDAAKAAEQFNDNMKAMSEAAKGIGITLVNDMAPTLAKISEEIKRAYLEGGKLSAVIEAIGQAGRAIIYDEYSTELQKASRELKALTAEYNNLAGAKAEPGTFMYWITNGNEQTNTRIAATTMRMSELRVQIQALKDAEARDKEHAAALTGLDDIVKAMNEENIAGTQARRKAMEEAKKAAETYKHEIASLEAEYAKLTGAGELEAYTLKLQTGELKKLSDADKEYLTSLKARNIEEQQAIKTRQELLKADNEYFKAMEAHKRVFESYEDSGKAIAEQMEFEISLTGKTAEEIAKLTEFRRLDLEMKKAAAALPEDATSEDIQRLLDANAAMKARVGVLKDTQAAIAGQRDSLRGWFDILEGGFQAAMHGAKSFGQYLKDTLLNLLYQLTAKPFLISIAASITGTSQSAAANILGGGNAASGAGSLLGSIGSAGGFLGGLGSLIGGGAGVAAPGMGFAAGVESFLLNSTGSIGVASAGGSLASGIATLGPYAAFAAAAYALYKAFAPKRGGPKEGGGFAGMFSGAGAMTSGGPNGWYGVDTANGGVQQLVNSTAQSLAQLVSRYGGSSSGFGIQFGYDTDPRGTAPNRLKAILSGASGQQIYGANYDFARGDPSAQIQLELSRLLVAGLRDSNIEDELKKLFNSFDLASATQQSIDDLMKQAEDLNFVLRGLAENTIGGITLESVRAAQQAGESLGQTFSRMVTEFQRVEAAVSAAIAGIYASAQSALGGQFASTFARSKLVGSYAQWQKLRGENFSFEEMLQHFKSFTPETLQQGIDATRSTYGEQGVALLQQLWADYATYMQALGTSTQNVASSFTDLAPIVSNFGAELANARANLAQYLQGSLVGNLSPLTPMQQYLEAKRQFDANLTLAQGGNIDAISNFGGLRDTFLNLSRSIFASSGQYNSDFFSTYNAGAGLTGGAVSPYTAQAAQQNTAQIVNALGGVVSALGDTISVRDEQVTAELAEVKAMLMRMGSGALTNTTGALA